MITPQGGPAAALGLTVGLKNDLAQMKAELDAQWLSKANGFLGDKGMYCEVLAFYTSDGKSSTPHLWIQIFKKA